MWMIDPSELDRWADTYNASGELPKLIFDLIYATIPSGDIESLEINYGSGVALPGYDCVLKVRRGKGNPWIPEGVSVWEFGKSKGAAGKFKSDYEKRTQQPLKIKQEETTFVFVSPRNSTLEKECEEFQNEGKWLDIKAHNASALALWMAESKTVLAEFKKKFALNGVLGYTHPDEEWEACTSLIKLPISKELALAGRDEALREFHCRLLKNTPEPIVVKGDSPYDALMFIFAGLYSLPKPELAIQLAKTVVVSDLAKLTELSFTQLHNVILTNCDEYPYPLKNQRLLVPVGGGRVLSSNPIELNRPRVAEFVEYLPDLNFDGFDARTCARECARSLTILRRKYSTLGSIPPDWVHSVIELAPVILLGRWNCYNSDDQEVVKKIYGAKGNPNHDYEDIEDELSKFIAVDDYPVVKIDDMWSAVSVVDLLECAGSRLSVKHLRVFSKIIVEVLKEIDPKLEVAPDDRALFSEKQMKYSRLLRSGIAEVLLALSDRGMHLPDFPFPKGNVETFFAEIFDQLRVHEDWKVLASLNDVLPELMEAAPDPLLSALEDMVEGDLSFFNEMVAEGSGIGGHSFHTGLLWGLERLAWSPAYFYRVISLLAILADVDPGGKLLNRPLTSLRDIFLPWHIQTYANLSMRKSALQNVTRKFPEVGWKLLCTLLPTDHQSTSGTDHPRLRDFSDEDLQLNEISEEHPYSGIFLLILEQVGTSVERWKDLLSSSLLSYEKYQKEMLQLLSEVVAQLEVKEERASYYQLLSSVVSRHTVYFAADWAFSKKVIDKLKGFRELVEPSDPSLVYKRLFDGKEEERYVRGDYEGRRARARLKRKEAFQEIQAELSFNELVEYALQRKNPKLLFLAWLDYLSSVEELLDVIRGVVRLSHTDEDSCVNIVLFLSANAAEKFETEWEEYLFSLDASSEWEAEVVGAMLCGVNSSLGLWKRIETLPSMYTHAYWEYYTPLDVKSVGQVGADFLMKKLLAHQKMHDAIRCSSELGEFLSGACLMNVGRALVSSLNSLGEDNVSDHTMLSYYVSEYLKVMAANDDVTLVMQAQIEYAFFPLLESHYDKDLALYDVLLSSPEEFMHLICDLYRAASDQDDSSNDESTTSDDQKSIRASFAWKILRKLKWSSEKSVDDAAASSALLQWVKSVQQLAEDKDRIEIVDLTIGGIMARDCHAGESWPSVAVCKAFEETRSVAMSRGFLTGCFNKRGVHSRGIYEGGDQERELSRQYERWAKSIRAKYPRMAKVLDTMAKRWIEDAKRVDEDAKKRKFEAGGV